METNYLFVYGLLQSTFENEAARLVHAHCQLVGQGFFRGYLFDLGEYPGVIYEETSPYTVYGEVYKIINEKEKLIQFLDDFEGVGNQFKQPNEYRKDILPVQTKIGEVHASCYVYNRDPKGFKLVESGRYENMMGTRE